MVSIDSPKQMSKRKIANPTVRPNPNRPLQPPVPLRTSSDPPPRIRSAPLPITIPFDDSLHVVDQLPRVARNLILAGAKPRVFAFAVEDIRSASAISCPRSGLVLPQKDCVPPLEEPSATDGKPKPTRKRRKIQVADENADDDKHIPRSPNAFILWRSEVFARARSLNLAPADKARLTTQVSEQWKTQITEAVKEHYQYLAEIAKELHAQKHPDYKYCPKSAAEKAALKAIKDAKKKEAKERERDAKEAEKLAKKGKAASAATPVEVPIRKPVQVERLYKGYPSTAWGSEGPPQGWSTQDGLTIAQDDEEDAAASGSMGPHAGSRPPSPPPKQRRLQQVLPSRSTFDFTVPPNPWPTLSQGVSWSDAAPPPPAPSHHEASYSGNSHWTPSAPTGPAPQAHEYQAWPPQGGQYNHPDIIVSLPVGVVNEGLGLEGADSGLPSVLTTLEIGGSSSASSANQVYSLPQSANLGYDAVTGRAYVAEAPSAALALHAPPHSAPLDTQYVQMSISAAGSAIDAFLHQTLGYAGDLAGGASGGGMEQVATSEGQEGFWPDLLNQDFAGHTESIFGPSGTAAYAGVADGQVDINFGASSLIGQTDALATPHGLGIDIMMDEEGDDFISGNQLGWDMAGQLIRNGWGPSHQVDNGPDTASFPSGIFTAQGQMNFSTTPSVVPSPTETASYLSPATISPQSGLDSDMGGLSSAEHSPPPYEPPLEGFSSESAASKGPGRATFFTTAQPKQYVPSPLGQGSLKVVDADRPPEIPRASKPSLKNVQTSAGRRITKIASTLPPIPNLSMASSH